MKPSLTTRLGGALGAAALALLALYALGPARAQDDRRTHRVTIDQFAFDPAVITVRRGDTVVWVNADLAPHTVTASGRTWDTGRLEKDDAGRITFLKAGRHSYLCRYHPAMSGEIIVVAGQE